MLLHFTVQTSAIMVKTMMESCQLCSPQPINNNSNNLQNTVPHPPGFSTYDPVDRSSPVPDLDTQQVLDRCHQPLD